MKKVLIITYYWPPSGGAGVQRWLKFTKYLPEMGWAPIVITPENPSFINKDPSLEKEINPEVEVLRLPIWEPYNLSGIFSKKKKEHQKDLRLTEPKGLKDNLMLWARGNLLIPDPRGFWVNPVYNFLKDYLITNEIGHIITTGPPHSIHLIGLKIKRKLGLKWIADFRDPWTQWDVLDTFKLTSMARAKHRQLEQKVFKYADSVITVGNTMNEGFEKIGARNPQVITNGFDDADFPEMSSKVVNDIFTIRHIGTVDDLRDPRPFLRQLKKLTENGFKVRVEFIGNTNPLLKEYIDELELGEIITLKDYIPHDQVMEMFKSTDLLLLILANTHSSKLNITGKIFEYMASGCPILGVGDVEGDAAKIIKETKSGEVIAPENEEYLFEVLMKYIEGKTVSGNKAEIMKYSRKALTSKLVDILDSI